MLIAAEILIPAIIFLTWRAYTNRLGLTGQFAVSKVDTSELLNIVYGNASESSWKLLTTYINKLYTTVITTGVVKVTFVSSFAISLCAIFLMQKIPALNISRSRAKSLAALIIIGRIAYAIIILVAYLFDMSYQELTENASFSRYMSSYLCAEWLVIAYLILSSLHKEISAGRVIALLMVSIILGDSARYVRMMPQSLYGEPVSSPYKQIAETIENDANPYDKLLVVSNSDAGKNAIYLNYYLYDTDMTGKYFAKEFSAYNRDNVDLSDELIKDLRSYDYLYCFNSSEYIKELIGGYADTGSLVDGELYRITVDGNDIVLNKRGE